MPFKVINVSVDLMNHQATVVAMDQPPAPNQFKQVQINFPFNPPSREGDEKAQAIAAAKAVLQHALNEI